MLNHSKFAMSALLGLTLLPALANAAPAFITAAIRWPGGKAQFFLSDGTFVRYDIRADRADPDYPKPINNSTWPGMGPYGRQIIAAADSLDGNKAYFFLADGTYLRYDVKEGGVDRGYPQPVNNQNWPGLARYATRIIASLNWGGGKIQFFLSDGTYIRYDQRADSVDPGYPKRIDRETWPGLSPYVRDLGAAINWGDNKVYFFLEDGRYLRYDTVADRIDPGYPKPIDERSWPGLHGFFHRRP
jgi:hypothetical protein